MWLAQCLLLRNLQTSKRDKEKKIHAMRYGEIRELME